MKRIAGLYSPKASLELLAVSHGGVDVYQGAIAALVPVFVHERGYSLSAAAMIVLVSSLASSAVQPAFGYFGDRWQLRWLVPASIVITGLGLGTIGFSPEYWVAVVLAALTGFGVAAYHPSAARLARDYSGGDHVLMSWFALGGNIGFALAPVIAAITVGLLGLRASPLLMIPALVALLAALLSLRGYDAARPTLPKSTRTSIVQPEDWRSFRWLTAAILCRSVVFVGLSSFIAIFVEEVRDLGPSSGTIALTLLYIGGALGTFVGGQLTRRWSRVGIVRCSYACAIPALAGVLLAPGAAIYVFVALVSIFLYIPFSLQLTLAQDYLPQHIGTASGITLGLTVSFGGLASPIIGALADRTSLLFALTPLLLAGALGVAFLLQIVNPAPRVIETAVDVEPHLEPGRP